MAAALNVQAGPPPILSGSAGGTSVPPTQAPRPEYQAAVESYARGEYERVLDQLAELSRRRKLGVKDLLLQGAALVRLNRASEASGVFVLAQAQDPTDPSITLCLAEAAIVEGETGVARGYLRRLMQADRLATREFAGFLEVLALVRDSDLPGARKKMEAMPWPSSTAARLFAEAAIEIAQGRTEQAAARMDEAARVFGKSEALTFSDSLMSLGMMKRR